MLSPVVRIFLICCQINYVFGAGVQLHPRFETKNLDATRNEEELGYLTSSLYSSFWLPGRPTTLFMKMQRRFDFHALAIVVKIADLTPNEKIHMRLRYKCSPSDLEEAKELELPLNNDSILICYSSLPLSIDKERGDWDSSTSYVLKLNINTVWKGQTKVPFSYALTHYIRIQLDFWGSHWSLSSNGLFIRNWDALLQLNKDVHGKKYLSRYLTKEALDLMQGLKFNSYSGFRTEQFFDPDLVAVIASAPEFVQSTIGIGAKLIIGKSMGCRFSPYGPHGRSTSEIWFMSSQYYELWNRPGFKVMRIDTSTGKVTYSPYGLSAAASGATKHADGKKCTDGSGQFCPYIAVCRWTEYMPINSKPIFLDFDLAGYTLDDLGPDYTDRLKDVPVPTDECMLLTASPSRVTVFARGDERSVVCPIICSREEVEFRFYKGDFPLYPMRNDDRFDLTSLGAISVHRSGAVLLFGEHVTDKDAGRYRCTAGGKEAVLLVDIVSLPLFNIPKTAWTGGHLPSITYARIGRGYSLTCTVFHSGMRSVTLVPEFYVVVDKRKLAWTKLSGEEFARRLEFFDSKATTSVRRTEHSTSLSLQVSIVPPPTDVFDFSHRFVCNASVSTEDAQRFGVSEYSLQSATQVVVVPPPTNRDIESKMSPCCVEGCFGKNCVIEYTLSSEVQDRLKSIGLEAHGTFKAGNSVIDGETNKHVTYDKSTGKLKVETDKPVAEMTDAERKALAQMVAVFEYLVKGSNGSNASVSCEQNPLCVMSTDHSDKSVQDALRIGSKLKLDSIAAATGKTGISKADNITVHEILSQLLDSSENAAPTQVTSSQLVIALAAIAAAHLSA